MCSNCKEKHNHGHSHEHEHNHVHNHEHEHNHEHSHTGVLRIYGREILSTLFLIVVLILDHTGVFTDITSSPTEKNVITVISYLIALLPAGLPILKEMVEAWREGSVMNEFTLMVAAAAGAFIIGEYPEGVAVLLFYSFGEKMEDTASDDVRRRIKALLGKLPDNATVIDGERTYTTSPDKLSIGTLLLVRPGERVPIDGVLQGDLSVDFDTSAITGESVPRSYAPGTELQSGIIPVDKAVTVKTLRPFSDSSMSRIMKMIETAQTSKSPTEKLLRKITRWYTPVVFILALLLFFIPWIVSVASAEPFEWIKWLRRSLVFLVCSCPCALVVSIPLSYFASLGTASKKGLLFKGSGYVDAMRNVDTIYFDKTGTLTTGEFHVSGILPAAGISAEQLLAIAAALDAESKHPLAIAIVAEARNRDIALLPASDVTTVTHGITGIIDGKKIAVGSRKLLIKSGVSLPKTDGDGSEICIAANGSYLGSIFLLDNIKPEATEAIQALHHLGVKNISVLSGDRENAVARVAKAVGADSYLAELLPADKQKSIMAAREKGHKTAFVGDGINDAPAIAASDIGIAMGTLGSDIAMESADIVIAGDRLDKLPMAISIARKVRRVVTENVSFALGVKATVMILGAFGIATLWAAVFADTGVTLITIAWTLLRLRRS